MISVEHRPSPPKCHRATCKKTDLLTLYNTCPKSKEREVAYLVSASRITLYACLSQQVRQEHFRQAQKEEEAEYIGRRCQENGGRNCRIKIPFFQSQRNQEPEEACDDEIPDHGYQNDQSQKEIIISEIKNDAGDQSGHRPVD